MNDLFRFSLQVQEQETALSFLARHSSLSKSKIKDAMNKGAVHLSGKGRKRKRIRRAQAILFPGDLIDFFYSEQALSQVPATPTLLLDKKRYTIWYKPQGILSQGSDMGDHCALPRIAEKLLPQHGPAKVVHRLDRDASGLVLLAHDRATAAFFSELLQQNRMGKHYMATVWGNMGKAGESLFFDSDIDGKKAQTKARISFSSASYSCLDITLLTGRKHQIRIHLDRSGHSIIGDPAYGNKEVMRLAKVHKTGLQLCAVSLSFPCPLSKKQMTVTLPQTYHPAIPSFLQTAQDNMDSE